MEKAGFSLNEPRGRCFIKQKEAIREGDVCSPGKAFVLSSDAVFTVGRILVKINYRQKQFNTYCQRGTNGLELVG